MINRTIVLKRVISTTFEPVPNRIVKMQCAIRATRSAATTLGTPRRMENTKCTPFTNSSISIRIHRAFLMDISSYIVSAPGNSLIARGSLWGVLCFLSNRSTTYLLIKSVWFLLLLLFSTMYASHLALNDNNGYLRIMMCIPEKDNLEIVEVPPLPWSGSHGVKSQRRYSILHTIRPSLA